MHFVQTLSQPPLLNLAGEHSALESCWLRHKENLASEKKLTYEFIKRLKCVERWLKVCKKCSTSFFHTREMKLTWLILHLLAHVKVPTFESICKLFLPKILLKLTTRTFRIESPGYNQQCKKVKKKMRTINPQIISSFLFGSCSKICKVIELNWGQRYFQNWFAFYRLKWYYTLSQSKCVTTGSV